MFILAALVLAFVYLPFPWGIIIALLLIGMALD